MSYPVSATSAPGVVEILLLASLIFVAASFVTGYASLAYYVYHDASARGSKVPVVWAATGLLVFPLVVYAAVRGERKTEKTTEERWALTVAVGFLVPPVAASFLMSPDPVTSLVTIPGVMVVTLPAAYLLFIRRLARPSSPSA